MFLQGIKEESMKAKNKLLTLLILSAGAAVTTAGINKAIQFSAVSKNLLAEPEPLCFKWRLGNVYYTKEEMCIRDRLNSCQYIYFYFYDLFFIHVFVYKMHI